MYQLWSPTRIIRAGTSRQRTTVASRDHGDGEADAELLDRRVAVQEEAPEDEHHDGGGRGDHARARHEPADDAAAVVLPGVDVLLDLAHEEHLVVHRQPEEDGEHEERDVGDDRHRVVEADEPADQPHWKIAVSTP